MFQAAADAKSPSRKPKRIYRRGNPLSSAAKMQLCNGWKKETHKIVNVFLPDDIKNKFARLCKNGGLIQSEMTELTTQRTAAERKTVKSTLQ